MRRIILTLASFCLITVGHSAFAGLTDEVSKDQRELERTMGAIVRNKHFDKRGKFELAFTGGVMPYDSLIAHYMLGGRATWHLSDHFGWEIVDLQFVTPSLTSFTTGLVSSKGIDDLQTSELKMIATTNLLISPFYGKIRFIGRMVLFYDIYIVAGLGLTEVNTLKVSAASQNATPTESRVRNNWDPTLNFGFGFKVFYTDLFGFIIDFRDYVIFTELYGEKRLHSNFSVFFGINFFLPTFG